MKAKLNLFDLSNATKLSQSAQKKVLGGCGCGCYYDGCGGPDSATNACYNADFGYSSPYIGRPVSKPGVLCAEIQ